MNHSSDEFSEYREYSGKLQAAHYPHYADPEYYQQGMSPRSTQSARPQKFGAGYNDYAQSSDHAHRDGQMQEYRGPSMTEGYVEDVGAEQREAAERGNMEGKKRRGRLAGIGSVLIAIGAWLVKLKSLAFFWAGISALGSIAIYSLAYGWVFAIGLVAQLFIHEMGHAIVMKIKGIPMGGMIFIPMLGAAVTMRQMPKNAQDEAEVGIAGPIAGAIGASICLLIARIPDASPVWASLAYFGFFINLFNLIPIVPFDGGRVLAAVDRRIWILGFAGLLGFQIWSWMQGSASPWLIFFVFLAATQLWSRGLAPSTEESRVYYRVPLTTRVVITGLYFGLAAALFLGMTMAHALLPIAQ